MARRWFLLLAQMISIATVTSTAVAQDAVNWTLMARQEINLQAGLAVVDVSSTTHPIGAIRLTTRAPLAISSVVIGFPGGNRFFQRRDVRPTGSATNQVIDLPASCTPQPLLFVITNRACFIDRIDIAYERAPSAGRIEIEIWGATQDPKSAAAANCKAAAISGDADPQTTHATALERALSVWMRKVATEHGESWAKPESANYQHVGCSRSRAGAQRPYTCAVSALPCATISENALTARSAGAKSFTPVRVFFGTDRKQDVGAGRIRFGAERADSLQLGQAVVTVPRATDRRRGEIRLPTWWERNVLRVGGGDPAKHFTIISDAIRLYKNADEFLQAVRGQAAEARDFRDHAFVFIHGFNVPFDAALFRTAQIAYDLGYDEPDGIHVPFGTAFLYSWPSSGEVSGYVYDQDSARLAQDHVEEFLNMVVSKSGATYVHVIAHSMGNIALLNALRKLSASPQSTRPITELILAAPDVDATEFEKIAKAVTAVAQGTTLFASSKDLAMRAAREIRRGVPRAGDVLVAGPVVADQVYTIDISALSTEVFSLQHANYAERSELLDDIRRLFTTGEEPPDKRNRNYRRRTKGTAAYWKYGD